jgi:glycosyltransferase involved in cell wall biosynthesis
VSRSKPFKLFLNFEAYHLIYDYLDDIETFYGDREKMRRDHQAALQQADLVLTTARRLYEQARLMRPDALLCPNGVDYQHFEVCHLPVEKPPPEDIGPILGLGKPIIGYYGALARWFDYELLKQAADLRPDLSFVLIGVDLDGTLFPSQILKKGNIHWLGIKPYQELPEYLRYFKVAIIPFVLNDITHSTSPLKMFEYMAGGKPVVATAMEEVMHYAPVLIAHDLPQFSGELDHALGLAADADYLQQVDQIARENTWNKRAMQILAALNL